MQRMPVTSYHMSNGIFVPHVQLDGTDREVHLGLQPGAGEALCASPFRETCISGPRGPGKTISLLADFAQHVGVGLGVNWKGILLRKSLQGFAELKSLAENYLLRIFPSATYNQNSAFYKFVTGETLQLKYFDGDLDYQQYQGSSYPWIGFEELTQWQTDKALRMMISCNRSAVPSVPLKIRATTNPDGPGHSWVKSRYGASDAYALKEYTLGPVIPADDIGPERIMIYARLLENQVLLQVQPDYLASIKTSATDEGRFESWVNGSWSILSGDMFSDITTTCKEYFTLPEIPASAIPPSWRIDLSLDWGSSHPFSLIWTAESDGSDIHHDGITYRFRAGDLLMFQSWYGQGRGSNIGLRLNAPDIARGIVEREVRAGLRYQDHNGKWIRRVKRGPADTGIFDKGIGDTSSLADQFEARVMYNGISHRGIFFDPADKGPGSRVMGWQILRSRLAATKPDENGYRERAGLFVCENVREFFSTVLTLPRDLEKNPEDVLKSEALEDHCGDCVRYRLRHHTTRNVTSRRHN